MSLQSCNLAYYVQLKKCCYFLFLHFKIHQDKWTIIIENPKIFKIQIEVKQILMLPNKIIYVGNLNFFLE